MKRLIVDIAPGRADRPRGDGGKDAKMSNTTGSMVERWDALDRFVRVHVTTGGERAVYLSLVGGSPGTYRSADEIASEHGAEPSEVEGALRRFEEAGIVEASEDWGPRRYRWRDDMRYLERGRQAWSGSVDPVCGMPVRHETPHRLKDAEGGELGFCSSLCLAAFRAFPAAFQPAEPTKVPSAGGGGQG